MENSLYVGLSRQMVLQTAMSMVSNNVANMNTPGYRNQNPLFEEFLAPDKGMKDPLSMVFDRGQYQTTAPGGFQLTGGTYDVALNGPGFMTINTRDGKQMFTRAGNFTVNGQNTLVTSSGFVVGGNGSAPIVIPAGSRDVKIAENGDVVADGSVVGRIGIVEFDNLQSLRPEGNGLYSSEDAPKAATETIMKQGVLENSNVKPVVEMTRMIEIMRDYQSTQRMIQNEHDRQRSAIEKLGDLKS